jgi:hypothetical protein
MGMMIASCYRSIAPKSYRVNKFSHVKNKTINTTLESPPETVPESDQQKYLIRLYHFSGTGTCTWQNKESEGDPLKNPGKLTDMIH